MSSVIGSSSLSALKQCFSPSPGASGRKAGLHSYSQPPSGARPRGWSSAEAAASDSWTELNCLVSNSELHSGTVTYDSHYIPCPSALHTHIMRKFILKNWPAVWLLQFSLIEEPRYTNCTVCFPSWVLSLETLYWVLSLVGLRGTQQPYRLLFTVSRKVVS